MAWYKPPTSPPSAAPSVDKQLAQSRKLTKDIFDFMMKHPDDPPPSVMIAALAQLLGSGIAAMYESGEFKEGVTLEATIENITGVIREEAQNLLDWIKRKKDDAA